ncbi:MAG: uroporphyrinogen decarboxylase family protein [Candidatus Aminicenantes bacterium]|jgi:uroporphyrinogen decarboxylase
MNSRERILAALNHRLPDKMPIDFSGHRSSGIAALAYPKLREFTGLPPAPVRVYDLVQQLAIVDEDILDRFGVDTIEMGRGFLKEEKDWKEWILPDGTACLIPYYIHLEKRGDDWAVLTDNGIELGIQKKGWLYFEQTYFPLMERGIRDDDFSDLEDVLNDTIWTGAVSPGAHLPLDGEGREEMIRGARALRESTDRAIIGLFGGNMFEVPQMLYRMDNYLMALRLYSEAVMRLSEKLCGIYLKNLEKWLGAVGPYIDIVMFGDDLGAQTGPLISPEMYRRFFKPFHQKLWSRAKELADVKVQLHCCGGVRELLPDLIDAGLDAINPVQFNCAGMDTSELKENFGKDLTFWGGGCDTRDILPNASPEIVRKHVHEQVANLSPGGGFVFQQVHNILANVPAENIIAMFDAVNDFELHSKM